MAKFINGSLFGAGITIFLGALWFHYAGTAVVSAIITVWVTIGISAATEGK